MLAPHQLCSWQRVLECSAMSDVIDLYGNCEAEVCRREDRAITDGADSVVVREKQYHRGCEPSPTGIESARSLQLVPRAIPFAIVPRLKKAPRHFPCVREGTTRQNRADCFGRQSGHSSRCWCNRELARFALSPYRRTSSVCSLPEFSNFLYAIHARISSPRNFRCSSHDIT